jgi:hypothetical protein
MHRAARTLHLIMVRPTVLGALLGLANVIALTQLYALVGVDPQHAGFVLAYGALPSLIAGTLLGIVAGALAHVRPQTRIWLLCTLATLAVIAIGVTMRRASFTLPALVPTLACTLLLERWSRGTRTLAYDEDFVGVRAQKAAVHMGMFLGALTMFVNMLAAALTLAHSTLDALTGVLELYLPFGLLTGTFLGLPFGALASATRSEPVWVRRLVLTTLAAELTFVIGALCACMPLIAPAMVPTLAACLVLESRTRAAPKVPLASASISPA